MSAVAHSVIASSRVVAFGTWPAARQPSPLSGVPQEKSWLVAPAAGNAANAMRSRSERSLVDGIEASKRIRRGDADQTLISEFIGGPLDGRRTADWPPQLSCKSLHGMVSKTPLSQPARGSIFAVYRCTSEAQVGGYWRFEFVRLEGPNGERLVAAAKNLKSSGDAS